MIGIDLILPVLFLAAVAGLARATLGSWLAPGAFFPLFWTGLCVLCLGVNEYYPMWAPALWWIDLSLVLFFVGSLGGRLRIRSAAEPPAESKSLDLPRLETTVIFCSLVGVLYTLFRERFAPGLLDKPPSWYQVFLGMLYAAPLFGGILFADQPSARAKTVSLFSLAPALFYALASLGRSQFLLGIFFWAASYWGTRIYRSRGKVPLLNLQMATLALLFLVVSYVVGTVLGRLRDVGHLPLAERFGAYHEVLEHADLERDLENFRGSAFGHPYSFSYYLNRTIDFPPTPRLGACLFAGPLDLLGLAQRTPFENFVLDTGVESNVYTLFRPPIEDFGLMGSLVSFLIAGFIAGFAYSSIAAGDIRWLPILTLFYPHVMVVGGLFFAYNSFTLALCLLAAYLMFAARRSRRLRGSQVFFNPTAPLDAGRHVEGQPVLPNRASRCELQS
jgi:hypothetical protein